MINGTEIKLFRFQEMQRPRGHLSNAGGQRVADCQITSDSSVEQEWEWITSSGR